MVERYIDKKIRTLREILQASADEKLDNDGKSHTCRYIDSGAIAVPIKPLMDILGELKLTVSSKYNIPSTNDYLLEVIIEKKDINGLSTTLKEYERQFPKRKKPLIREKALEIIAVKIGGLDTGSNLVKFLKDCGVDQELIIYPNTKWKMVYDALIYLNFSSRKEDAKTLSRIIGEATHPLMHNGDVSSAETLRNEFNNYLSYNNMGIGYDENDGTYWALRNAGSDEIDSVVFVEQAEAERQKEKQLKFLCQPKNREKISLLRKTFQSLMNVVYAFCENPTHPTLKLNDAYKFLNELVWEIINDLGLRGEKSIYNFDNYTSPFVNLFVAEKHYQEQKRWLSLQMIRPEMNAIYGDIEELYQKVNGSDILIASNNRKRLNNIKLYLSKLEKGRDRKIGKHKKVRAALKTQTNKQELMSLKIVELPEIKVSGLQTPLPTKFVKISPSKLYLNNVGDLWREPKSKYHYPMGEKSNRHKIVRFLTTHSGYQPTSTISLECEGKSKQSTRTEIAKIRKNIKKFLGIDGKQVIEGRKGSGYKISSKHKIKLKKK